MDPKALCVARAAAAILAVEAEAIVDAVGAKEFTDECAVFFREPDVRTIFIRQTPAGAGTFAYSVSMESMKVDKGDLIVWVAKQGKGKVNPNSFQSDTLVGVIRDNILTSICTELRDILQPAVVNQSHWGQMGKNNAAGQVISKHSVDSDDIRTFLGKISEYSEEIENMSTVLDGWFTLEPISDDIASGFSNLLGGKIQSIEKEAFKEEVVEIARQNEGFCVRAQNLLMRWTKALKVFILETKLVNKESSEFQPDQEMINNKSKHIKYANVRRQIEAPDVRAIFKIVKEYERHVFIRDYVNVQKKSGNQMQGKQKVKLTAADYKKSDILNEFIRVKNEIINTETYYGLVVKYLNMIEGILTPIYQSDFRALITSISSIIRNISSSTMIFSEQEGRVNYSDVLSKVSIKITNQLIMNCRAYIKLTNLSREAASYIAKITKAQNGDDENSENEDGDSKSGQNGSNGNAGKSSSGQNNGQQNSANNGNNNSNNNGNNKGADNTGSGPVMVNGIDISKWSVNQIEENLFMKDTNQIIERIEDCVRLNNFYKKAICTYFGEKDDYLKYINTSIEMRDMGASMSFQDQQEGYYRINNFSESLFFGNFDLFCNHLMKIRNIFIIISDIENLKIVTVSDVRPISPDPNTSMVIIIKKAQEMLQCFLNKKYDLLNHRNFQFRNDYDNYQKLLMNLEEKISALVDKCLKFEYTNDSAMNIDGMTIREMLMVFNQLRRLGITSKLIDKISGKMNDIINVYETELDYVKDMYNNYKGIPADPSMDPTIPRNMPAVSGKVFWIDQLIKYIEIPMAFFREPENRAFLYEQKSEKNKATCYRLIMKYNTLINTFTKYKTTLFDRWKTHTSGAAEFLSSPLFISPTNQTSMFSSDSQNKDGTSTIKVSSPTTNSVNNVSFSEHSSPTKVNLTSQQDQQSVNNDTIKTVTLASISPYLASLEVNFDYRIIDLIREIKYFKFLNYIGKEIRIKNFNNNSGNSLSSSESNGVSSIYSLGDDYNIPSKLIALGMREEELINTYNTLSSFITKLNSVVVKINPLVINLFVPFIRQIEYNITSSKMSICWNSQQTTIASFIRRLESLVKTIEDNNIIVSNIIENRIKLSILTISNICLGYFPVIKKGGKNDSNNNSSTNNSNNAGNNEGGNSARGNNGNNNNGGGNGIRGSGSFSSSDTVVERQLQETTNSSVMSIQNYVSKMRARTLECAKAINHNSDLICRAANDIINSLSLSILNNCRIVSDLQNKGMTSRPLQTGMSDGTVSRGSTARLNSAILDSRSQTTRLRTGTASRLDTATLSGSRTRRGSVSGAAGSTITTKYESDCLTFVRTLHDVTNIAVFLSVERSLRVFINRINKDQILGDDKNGNRTAMSLSLLKLQSIFSETNKNYTEPLVCIDVDSLSNNVKLNPTISDIKVMFKEVINNILIVSAAVPLWDIKASNIKLIQTNPFEKSGRYSSMDEHSELASSRMKSKKTVILPNINEIPENSVYIPEQIPENDIPSTTQKNISPKLETHNIHVSRSNKLDYKPKIIARIIPNKKLDIENMVKKQALEYSMENPSESTFFKEVCVSRLILKLVIIILNKIKGLETAIGDTVITIHRTLTADNVLNNIKRMLMSIDKEKASISGLNDGTNGGKDSTGTTVKTKASNDDNNNNGGDNSNTSNNDTYKTCMEINSSIYDIIIENIKSINTAVNNIYNQETSVRVGPITLNFYPMIQTALNDLNFHRNTILSSLNDLARKDLTNINFMLNDVISTFSKDVENLNDCRNTMRMLSMFREFESIVDLKITPIENSYNILIANNYKINAEEKDQIDQLRYRIKQAQVASGNSTSILLKIQPSLKEELVKNLATFKVTVKNFVENYEKNGPNTPGIKPAEAIAKLKEFNVMFQQNENLYIQYNDGEVLFGLTQTEFPELHRIKKELRILNQIYSLYTDVISTIDGYYNILWNDIDVAAIQNKISEYQARCYKLPMKNYSADDPSASGVLMAYNELRQKIDDFLETLPLVQSLSHPAVKDRHWQKIAEILKENQEKANKSKDAKDNQQNKQETKEVLNFDEINPNTNIETYKLHDLLKFPLLDIKEDVEDICNAAVKETDIEAKLSEIVEDWKGMEFILDDFKSRGKLLLSASVTSDIITSLEDSQMSLQSLLSNRYNAPFKSEIQKWTLYLSTTDELLGKWLFVQQQWSYLEAVFNGGDISRQLPQEAKRFNNIDKTYVRIMNNVEANPNIIYITNQDSTLKENLDPLLESLEQCQKSLSGYLEQKRNLFSRFYFVSDPVLLEILGNQSTPQNIVVHMSAIFDNINNVTFDKVKNKNITHIIDKMGEQVMLNEDVVAQGNVEDWLNKLIDVMQHTLKDIIRTSTSTLSKIEITTGAPNKGQEGDMDAGMGGGGDNGMTLFDFIQTYPAQVSLLGIQLLWTMWSETGIRIAGSQSPESRSIMAKTAKKISDVLNNLVYITTQNLEKRLRTCVETLITIQVHQKDIFDSLMAQRIRSIFDFEWLKQTRFYWLIEKDTCVIRITDIDFEYNYEYLGTNERLVITPLTDRCYITLAQAIGMYLGGAPAGPAGTGKTETVKDMGKTMGMYVVVFNCSDQMDYKGLGKIFRGLAQAGCWGDFDEFNRIELDVLSVAAQQIACILNAIKEHRKQFVYTDGQTVPLNTQCAMFITMNPGYAGRQELPENLKALFRTVAMMVPDREIIIRVKLASAGFMNSTKLAKKFFILYQLCEEQLSGQRHYDFGLRNILSVLRTCGARRRANPEHTEDMILMRVLLDMNMSKLVDEDEPLFVSLTGDLFPGLKVQKATYPELEAAIDETIEETGLTSHPSWNLSVIQLYETCLVRHGIMVLGPSQAGKSNTIKTLAKAYTKTGVKHTIWRMNPKAITAPQMFGKLTVATGDWTDGIFATLWRKAFKRQGDHIWIVLDGPVDAIWIENLNTVLDDNKTLTLANSDRILMSTTLKLIFEVDSLENASPATVSRAGMIYMSASALGWNPVFQAWLKQKSERQVQPINTTVDALMSKLLQALKLNFKPVMKIPEVSLIRTAMQIIDALTLNNTRDGKSAPDLPEQHLVRITIFALMWSFGGLLDLSDRITLSRLIMKESSRLPLPKEDGLRSDDSAAVTEEDIQKEVTLFDYFVDDSGEWKKWKTILPSYNYPPDMDPPFKSILVPTVDNICSMHILDKLVLNGSNVMFIGESGSGKTVNILKYLDDQDQDKVLTRVVNFSSATTPNLFQANIEGFIEKRMGTTYGPKAGKKGIVFVDDVNMPTVNTWGDQETNEFTRQLLEDKGFYSLERPGEFLNIADISYLAAMPHPGGGRNDIPMRLKGHFCVFNITLPGPASLDNIFGTIVKGHYSTSRGFSEEICQLASELVSLTRTVWQATKNKMLPTPAKLHYIFNLRDLSRITQGFINSENNIINTQDDLLALWANECRRVLPDKFTGNDDIQWFEKELVRQVTLKFDQDAARSIQSKVYFADFMRDAGDMENDDDNNDDDDEEDLERPRIYEPIRDINEVKERINVFIGRYNMENRRGQLDLVLFQDAVEHVLRISRILAYPMGNALLVGVGGSGKQSLAKLASFINGYKTFRIVITRSYNIGNFDDDLKELYKIAGVEGSGVSFLFTDNDVKEEIFLERINNILTSGEVPALFAKDDMVQIINDVRPAFKKEHPRGADTDDVIWNYFMERVKNNLHVILCFSPVGEKFRNRARKFPGLISGCTTDWFQPWPYEALVEVSRKSVSQFEELVATPEVKEQLINNFASIHTGMSEITQEYFSRFRRNTYVTPKSYLSFLESFMELYKIKKAELTKLSTRLNNGLTKLVNAANGVANMQVELGEKKKHLAVAQEKASEMLVKITSSTTIAEKKKAEVQKVKDDLQKEADIITAQKADAQEGLDKALPALIAAEKALNSIKASDIATVKSLGKPPNLIQRIMDGVLILQNQKIEPIKMDPNNPGKMITSWSNSIKVMADVNFLQKLLNFERDGITNEMCELLLPYIEMSDFNIEGAKRSCGNVAGLVQWVLAMDTYHRIALDVEPKRMALIAAEEKYKVAMRELANAQADLDEKQAALDALQAQYDAAMAEKQRLQDDAELTENRLHAATALINGLSGERVRWGKQSKELDEDLRKLVGDVMLAAAFLSYAGPFNQEFRNKLLGEVWIKEIHHRNIPISDKIEDRITKFLVAESTVGEWNLQGLPTDDLSTQNGIIVTSAQRYPLLIDPQGQGAKWIINKESSKGLKVTTLNNKYFRQFLEDSLNLGTPLLIQDVGEELDPVLDPILEKQFEKRGKKLKVWVGDKECDVEPGFYIYITTKIANPNYSPETFAKTSVIDFTVTFIGLEAQLLTRTVNIERRELEEQRHALLEEVNKNKKKAEQLEEDLLTRLSTSQGNLLDDKELIDVLARTKVTTEEVQEKIKGAIVMEERINTARSEYIDVATRGSILYFLIADLNLVNHMYQTSLDQFLIWFDSSIKSAEQSPITQKRINNVINTMTYNIFINVSRGLFESHKMLFVLLLTLKIDLKAGKITQSEFNTFIKGGAALDINNERRKPGNWIPDNSWLNAIALSNNVNVFSNLPAQIIDNEAGWKKWYDDEEPEKAPLPFPQDYIGRITEFQKLLLVRSLREDRAMLAATSYIIDSLGEKYAESVSIDLGVLEEILNSMKPTTPLIFLLSLGSDPTGMLESIAKRNKIPLNSISMGQGQEVLARNMINEGFQSGAWVMISNSHLGLKFMEEIETILIDKEKEIEALEARDEEGNNNTISVSLGSNNEPNDENGDGLDKTGEEKENAASANNNNAPADTNPEHPRPPANSNITPASIVNPQFRLLLTTEPHNKFPISLLQHSLKLTNDPPTGQRAGLRRSYQMMNNDIVESVNNNSAWTPLLYVIAFLHSSVQERRKFGPLGWCVDGSSLINVADSRKLVKIENIKEGDVVMTSEGPKTVTVKWDRGIRKSLTVSIKSLGIELKATPEHKVLAHKKSSIKAEPEWIKLEELAKGDYLIIDTKKTESYNNDNNEHNEHNITYYNSQIYAILSSLSSTEKQEFIFESKYDLESVLYAYEKSDLKDKLSLENVSSPSSSTTDNILLIQSNNCNNIDESLITELDKKCKIEFIASVIGFNEINVSMPENKLEIVFKNRNVVHLISKLLNEVIDMKYTVSNDDNDNNNNVLTIVNDEILKFYKEIGIRFNEKYNEIILGLCSKIISGEDKVIDEIYPSRIVKTHENDKIAYISSCIYIPIEEITTADEDCHVYDIAVDGKPEYYANGILCHNCIPYEFSTPDFSASVQFLQTYLYGLDSSSATNAKKGPTISFSTIRYMIAEVHYGGRVTDNYDRRLLKTYADEWLNPRVLQPDFEFAPGYIIPKYNNVDEVRTYIDKLPLLDKPQVYGLHANAELTYRAKQANDVLGTILQIQPKDASSGGGETREDVVLRLATDILNKLPPDFNPIATKSQIDSMGGKSKPMNVFLGQEVDRMQRVLSTMKSTLKDLQLAIAGTIIMSQVLQDVLNSLFDAKVPPSWTRISWPSSTIGFFLSDVMNRCAQYTQWLEKKALKVFWLSGFFNPTGFLTSMKQDMTRINKWSLDLVNLVTEVTKYPDGNAVNKAPEAGVYIHGLYLDGAGFKGGYLCDPPPKTLFVLLPVLHIYAQDKPVDTSGKYECPVYRTSMRTDLNFIFAVQLPTNDSPRKWILRGTALLCSTT